VPGLARISVDQLTAWLTEKARSAAASTVRKAADAATADGPKVFLSYRRSDTETMAEVLFWCLMAKVDGIRLFRDKDTLQPGMVFADVIDGNIAKCDVVIVLIGKDWLTAKGKDGSLRLHAEGDWVRMEIASALRQKKRVFPCLIDGAGMPSAEELPADLQGMAALNATSISLGDVGRDVEKLLKVL
jgi:hypothetical protein